MHFEITKEFFEMAVPAFKSASTNTFEKMLTFLEGVDATLALTLGSCLEEVKKDMSLSDAAKKLVCVTAARVAIPQLDLVMTSQGFGIVSNSNVAPASRERVLSLMEQLRKEESNQEEIFELALLHTSWKDTKMAESTVWGLLWSPGLLRRYGIRYQDKTIYAEELNLLKTDIMMAEEQLTNIISNDLYIVLLEHVRCRTKDLDPAYDLVLEKSRKYMAAILRKDDRFAATMVKSLQTVLNENEHVLKEYEQSGVCQAIKMPRYENKKEDPCVFF